MEKELRKKFLIPDNWIVTHGKTEEKERSNQSTEKTIYTATSPDGNEEKTFTYTVFTDHRGTREFWTEGR